MKTLTLTEFDITLLQGALEHLQEQLLIDRDPFAVDLDDAPEYEHWLDGIDSLLNRLHDHA